MLEACWGLRLGSGQGQGGFLESALISLSSPNLTPTSKATATQGSSDSLSCPSQAPDQQASWRTLETKNKRRKRPTSKKGQQGSRGRREREAQL